LKWKKLFIYKVF